jgi:hypothetical protein
MTDIRELDVVQLTADQPSGLVEGARGAPAGFDRPRGVTAPLL